MGPEELAALRRVAEQATPGPWALPGANVFRVIAPEAPHTNPPSGKAPPYPWRIVCDTGAEESAPSDARHIAAFNPQTVLALIAELEKHVKPSDRTVHAENDYWEVARYDRQGKWWLEPKGEGKRVPLTIEEAVTEAIRVWNDEGTVHFARPGGSAFDRKIRERAAR